MLSINLLIWKMEYFLYTPGYSMIGKNKESKKNFNDSILIFIFREQTEIHKIEILLNITIMIYK